MLSQIQSHFQKGQFKEVFELVGDQETNLSIIELKGMSALQLNDYSSSRLIFKKLIKLENKASHYYHYALSLMNLNLLTEAIEAFMVSKLEQKFYIPSSINSAHCHLKLKNYSNTEVILLEILKNNKMIKPVHFMLLNLYRQQESYEKLSHQLELSKAFCSMDYEWCKNRCYYLFYSKRYQEVINFIESLKFDNVELLTIKAKANIKNNSFEKAVKIFNQIVKLDPKSDAHWYNLAASYSHLTSSKDLNLSIAAAEKCILINSNNHQSYYCMSITYEKLKKYKEAIVAIKKSISLDENNLEYKYKLADLFNIIGDYTQSQSILNFIINRDDSFQLAHRLKGIILLKQEKFIESEKSLSISNLMDNRDQRTIAYYAISKLAQNKLNEVEEFLGLGHLVREFELVPSKEYLNINEFNLDLTKDIKQHSQLRLEPHGLAAKNGYLTDDLFFDNKKSIVLFKKLLLEKINEYIDDLPFDPRHHMLRHKTKDYHLNSWATWVKGDGYIDKHIHEESWISGAYYCSIPEITGRTKNHDGYFEYGCIPNDLDIEISKQRGYIKPTVGKLVIFPSYLYHQTIPHKTEEDRISIAFDLTPNSWLR